MEILPLLTEQILNNQPSEDGSIVQKKSTQALPIATSMESSISLLNQLFPEQKREDKTIKQTRAILGGMVNQFSSEELQEIISLSQYLTESWIDMWERELFDGKTLQELLNLG